MPVSVSASVMMVQRAVISYVPPRNTRDSGTAMHVVRMSVICIVGPPSSPLLHAPFALGDPPFCQQHRTQGQQPPELGLMLLSLPRLSSMVTSSNRSSP